MRQSMRKYFIFLILPLPIFNDNNGSRTTSYYSGNPVMKISVETIWITQCLSIACQPNEDLRRGDEDTV